MNSLRSRLIAVFLVATIMPLVVTTVIMSFLLEQSLSYSSTEELDRLSKTLEATGREYYVQAREVLRRDAKSGGIEPQSFVAAGVTADDDSWPASVDEFWRSDESERFSLVDGDLLEYLVRDGDVVRRYTRAFGDVQMDDLQTQISAARASVARSRDRDLRRGLTSVLLILMAVVWVVSFLTLIFVANRMSRPIEQLTTGLSQLAAGNLSTRIDTERTDEIGRAVDAFNHTAQQLKENRERLVYLTQVASWQTLARKMAHELKNSLTPIRLTVEEIRARSSGDKQFMQEAVQIVVDEIESLERRVRAFSEFSSEPAVHLASVDVNAVIRERVSFLKSGHPVITYTLELAKTGPRALADEDRVKGILNNLLENAAEATVEGEIVCRSFVEEGKVVIEVHDSGPGLSEEARRTLFEPAISFKDKGMGLGLSIARKDALVCGGDLLLVEESRPGACFRLLLPVYNV